MSGHYEEREIKFIEETYFNDNTSSVNYELRAYNRDGTYDVLASSDDLTDIFRWTWIRG